MRGRLVFIRVSMCVCVGESKPLVGRVKRVLKGYNHGFQSLGSSGVVGLVLL